MTQPAGIYPFSTQDGKPIPLDIIKAKGVILQAFTSTGISAFTIPADVVVGVIVSKAACVLRFGVTAVPTVFEGGVLYEDCILIPEGGIITAVLTPGPVSVIGLDGPGLLCIQLIEQWAGLGLPLQYGRK